MIGYILAAMLLAAIGFILFSPVFKGRRTQIAASITATVGGVLPLIHDNLAPFLPYANDVITYLKDLDWRQYVGADNAPWVMLATGVLFYVLRRMTTGPAGAK